MTAVAIDATRLRGADAYKLMVDTIVPRPVAWITTTGPAGETNLAPFSFFNGVCARPPTLSVAVSSRPLPGGGFGPKDTARFAEAVGAFVVHLVPADRAAQVEATAADLPAGTDVPAMLGLSTAPGTWVSVRRLLDVPVALECRLAQVVLVGSPPTRLLLGEILGAHVLDDVLRDGRPIASRWDPLARLGVEGFAPPRS